jgi:carbon monoxide dehydrogenase subunit G
MSEHTFSGSAVIDRPPETVFDFVADGTNDPKFSPRVQEISKRGDEPVGVGTVFVSKVKDAGMKSDREFELTAFERPTRIRWREISKNMITADEGGYDLEPDGAGTRLTIHNQLVGHGFGKLLLPLALSQARKDADAFAGRIKAAVEAET